MIIKKRENKKAAMEMSMGTMVTIVLLMVLLVLGIFLIQRIFRAGEGAIDSVDAEVQSQIQKLFAGDGTQKVAIYPTSREITLKQGSSGRGFAFSVRNIDIESASFSYSTRATDVSKCGSGFTEERADSYLLGAQGTFNLVGGASLDNAVMVRFLIPESATPCPILYKVEVKKGDEPYSEFDIVVTIR